jgi:hypothetical protein
MQVSTWSRVLGLIAAMLLGACQHGPAGDGTRDGSTGVGAGADGHAGGSGGGPAQDAAPPANGGAGGAPAAPVDAQDLLEAAPPDPVDARAEGDAGGAPTGKNILMVVGDANGTVQVHGSGPGETFLRKRLEAVLGHHVTLIDDTTAKETMVKAALAADMVLVCESVSSVNLLAKLKDVPTAILSYEAFIQDDMGFTPPGPPGDPGEPTQFALGVRFMDTKIDIVDPQHPLAAGLTGTVAVYTAAREITWGKVAKTAEVVATLNGDASGAAIYVYRQGVTLYDGTAAAGLRVNFFLEDDNKTGTPNLMTPDGLRLFDTAVKFVLAGGH